MALLYIGRKELISHARCQRLLMLALSKFRRLDYGDISFEDKLVNDDALKYWDRVIAVYETIQDKIWIIAESETEERYTTITILFLYEY